MSVRVRAWSTCVAVIAGVVLTGAGSAHASASVAAADPGGPVTVAGTNGRAVTVDQASELVNQTVHVSWTGFVPSSAPVVQPTVTTHVVRVYQCHGDAPAGPQDCYGSSKYTFPGQSDPSDVLPDGPTNHRDAATATDGTGGLDFEVRTASESSTLGCSVDVACSIVVVPNDGNGHRGQDWIFATTAHMDDPFAWANHITVPIHMAPAGATCPLGTPGVVTAGAPMLQRALSSWQPAACNDSQAVAVDYTAVSEPAARAQYGSGSVDVGLTTLPLADGDTSRPTAYAPLAVAGIGIAYHLDDAVTGQPITDLKMDARLVAKLLTESYGGVGYIAPGQPVGNGNPHTVGNPASIWTDPEFLALNPGHAFPAAALTNPLLLAGNSDLTWELTRWIAADPDASAWLAGADDGHGMHVNTTYEGIQYPVSALETRDDYDPFTYTFVPVSGLDHVARGLVADQPSSSSPLVDVFGRHPKDPQQLPGQRALIAVIDTADSAAFTMPQAAIRNPAGAFVAPTAASMSAAVEDMAVDPRTGTRLAAPNSSDAAAYPLTMVQYAAVPTGGLSAAATDQVVRFLHYAANAGQVSGRTVGNLPLGYLPVTGSLRAQLDAATAAVRDQTGAVPVVTPTSTSDAASGDGTSGGGGGSSFPGGAAYPAGSASVPPVAGADPPVAGAAPTAAPTSAVNPSLAAVEVKGTPAAGDDWLVPTVLGVGGAAVLCGPLLLAWPSARRGLRRPGRRVAR